MSTRTVRKLRDEQAELWQSMLDIRDACEKDGRRLTPEERDTWDRTEKRLVGISEYIERIQRAEHQVTTLGRSHEIPDYADGKPLTREQKYEHFIRARGLAHPDEEQLDLGKYLRGIVVGDWEDADAERRAMSEGIQSAGGVLVPTILSAQLIDLARNQARVLQAGAQIVPMANRTVDVAKWTGDPSANWHSEGAPIPPSDGTLGKVTLTAQALTANTIVSRELIEDAPNVGDALTNAFTQQFALAIDKAAMYGSGTSPEPRGIKNTSGITVTIFGGANGGTPANFDFLIDAAAQLEINNEQAGGIVYAPRTAKTIAKFKDTQNQPLRTPEYIENIPRYSTNQVPTNLTVGTSTDCSDVFVADWSQLFVGVRTDLMIAPLRERYADTGQLGFVAWWRGDVAVARGAAFNVVSGVRP
ncbi:phage major capsid protein [Amycolatopsis anabasis]|uniref:phage major capsid protein n=1 Tax=Amycolatopsis anabasis TaxID=1840409 RepID=UPI00131A93F2|nr:phage major capsid protein [Amycolatopsis anabasis]